MRTIGLNHNHLTPLRCLTIRLLFPVAFALLAIISLSSCARKIAFNNSTVVPSATGNVKVKKDQNNNYSIDVSTKPGAA